MRSSCLRLALKRAELTLTILLLAAGASFAQSTGAPLPGAFGNVVIGGTEQLPISPKVSKFPVTFKPSTVSAGSGFSIVTDGCAGKTVPANSTCQITVQFAPGTTLGARTGTLQVNDNGLGYKQSLTLTGTGVQGTATFSSGAFGNVTDGLTKQLIVKAAVANFPVTFTSSTVSAGAGFTSVTDGCAGTSVQPGSTCSISVQFAPGTTTGNKTGTLQVNDNGVGFKQLIALTGTGVQAKINTNSNTKNNSKNNGKTNAKPVAPKNSKKK